MGADLYIEPEFTETGKWDGEFYFRDSYNRSNLLWTVGMSWWGAYAEKLLTNKSEMSPRNCAKWLKMFDDAKAKGQTLPKPQQGETAKDIAQYFAEKEKRFRAFFARAIKLKRKVIFSI